MQESFALSGLAVSSVELACFLRPGTPTEINHPNRPSWGIAFHTTSRVIYRFSDGTAVQAVPGSAVLLPKGSWYTVEKQQPGACYAVNFQLASETELSPMRFLVRRTDELERAFQQTVRAWNHREPGYAYQCLSGLYGILALLQNETSASYADLSRARYIEPAAELMRRCCTERTISVSELAGTCGMSEVYFRRLFHARYGMSPVEYRRRLQLDRAKELLRSSECTVAAAAELSGFCDTAYFCRVFRQQEGISPAAYRKQSTEE